MIRKLSCSTVTPLVLSMMDSSYRVPWDINAPIVTINPVDPIDLSPEISGTVDDTTAVIQVLISSLTYPTVNNGDGTWTLSAGTIPTLAPGNTPVQVQATDQIGNVSVIVGNLYHFDPILLFTDGEQGWWYDPSDLSTLFQDVNGVTPVTAVGQPVGLMLDKSRGLQLSEDILRSTWVNSAGATSGSGTVNLNSASDVFAYQDIMTPGVSYKVSFSYNLTSGTAGLYCGTNGGAGNNVIPLGNLSGQGNFSGVFVAGGSRFIFRDTSGGVSSFTDIKLKELPGNHQSIGTPASRPILRQNATTGAYYLETDGADDYMVSAPINFTGTDKVTIFCGIRKLSDAAAFPVILETGITATDVGSFHLYANASTIARGYAFAATGATQVWRKMSGDYAAPDSAVITVVGDLAATGDLAVPQRRNGIPQALSLGGGTSTGGGVFGNLPLYLFRRGGATLPWAGHFYGLIGVGRLTMISETANVELMLERKVGVALV